MEILHLRATVGPNLYSIDHPRLVILRLRGATPDQALAIAKSALSLQHVAGFEGSFVHLHELKEPGVINVVFETLTSPVGFAAARGAVDLAEGKGNTVEIDEAIRKAWRESKLLLSTQALVDEATRRGIPHLVLNQNSLVQLGYGCHQQRIQDTLTELTSIVAVDLAGSKMATSEFLASMGIPVPRHRVITRESEVEDAIRELGFPLVLKPRDGHQGQGVTTGVTNREAALVAFAGARQIGGNILVEEHVPGHDYRILVIDNRFVAASRRAPAAVIGDGQSSVLELIKQANLDPRRGRDHERPLTRLELNVSALQRLKIQGLTPDSIPENGREVGLQSTANLSTGGTATDVTEEVHPENVRLFERIGHLIGLDVAGLDVVAPDLRIPLHENGGKLIEVNAAPGFRMHLYPSSGIARNVCAPVIEKLFPEGTPSRIPILTVTGTNGKTTTTRLLAHLMSTPGRRVGFTSSDGIYVGGHRIRAGDCTDEFSTGAILKDPWVNLAVFEYPRGGLIRAGLGYDGSDVGVVLNVTGDHLGSRDVHTVEEMADVKAVIARSVLPSGYAVLNADDDRVFAMRKGLRSKFALFSLQKDNPRLLEAELRAVLQEGRLVLYRGKWPYPLANAADIPLTLGGRAIFMIQNVLAASLAAFCQGLRPEQIRQGLLTFDPGFAQTPGRMNYFYGDGYRVLVDYAHNVDSMQALQQFLEIAEADHPRVGVMGGTGDRLDADILELGRQAGRMFSRLIVREDHDTRGRRPGQTAELVQRGAIEANPEIETEIVLDPVESVRYAVATARPNDLICVLGGDVEESIAAVRERCRPTR